MNTFKVCDAFAMFISHALRCVTSVIHDYVITAKAHYVVCYLCCIILRDEMANRAPECQRLACVSSPHVRLISSTHCVALENANALFMYSNIHSIQGVSRFDETRYFRTFLHS